MMKLELQRLQKTLGYTFKDNNLLSLALSHRSLGANNNERLEFLGDSLLNFIIAEALYSLFPKEKEGTLSRMRAQLVKGETLAEIAVSMQLGDCLLMGGGELKSGGFRRASILADAVEALIGAIFLEAGMVECKERVLDWYEQRLDTATLANLTKDPKTLLQEYMQERNKALPRYRVIAEGGVPSARTFRIECLLPDTGQSFVAEASSKKQAEKLSAQQALASLEKNI